MYIYICKNHYQSWKRWRISPLNKWITSPHGSQKTWDHPWIGEVSSWDDSPSNVINLGKPIENQPTFLVIITFVNGFRYIFNTQLHQQGSTSQPREACISLFTSINSRHKRPEIMRTLQSHYYPTKLWTVIPYRNYKLYYWLVIPSPILKSYQVFAPSTREPAQKADRLRSLEMPMAQTSGGNGWKYGFCQIHGTVSPDFWLWNDFQHDFDMYFWLVVKPTPLKNMKVSWGYYSQYMEK